MRLEYPVHPDAKPITLVDLESQYHLSVVLLRCGGEMELHPSNSKTISPGKIVGVLGKPDQINILVHDFQ